ncbi:hypothetical protein CHCC14809_2266 [Bacillus licheniformis]|nr:SPBc2 prophage-derived uncharacterized protein YoqK [Bacillus licheniformis]TWM72107.1 hypothetical protein CHCC14809_2266 [Bacillus licheniformis]
MRIKRKGKLQMRILQKCFYEEAVYVYSDEFEANKHFIETLEPKGWEIDACWVGTEAGRLKQFYRYKKKTK